MFLAVVSLLFGQGQVQTDLPPLGTNLAGFADWSTEWPLVDVFKMARPWVSQKEGAEWGKGDPLDTDADGNVKSLKPGQFAETVIYSNGHHPAGKYTLTWDGKGRFEAHLGSTLTDVQPNRATLDVTGSNGIFLMLKKVDPSDPPKNIRLVMPGAEDWSDTAPFHPVFMQRMSLYRCLRFMDWGATNNSKVVKWSDRARPDQATFTSGSGVPLETMVALCNLKAAMPWFCVPHQADDNYVRSMAKLIKDQLRPDLKVAIEYSNECWNPGFDQHAWCVDQGKLQKLADNDTQAGLRYYSKRSVEIFALFEEAFNGKDRLVRILSAQAANPATGNEVVTYNNAFLKADALAIAPYFGYSLGTPESLESTKKGGVDGLFSALDAEIKGSVRDNLDKYSQIARRNKLRLVSYEGGQHLAGVGLAQNDPALNELFDEANRSDQMRATYTSFFKNWRSVGGTLFMHFTDCAPFSKYGRWGTLEYQDQDPQTSPKNTALIQYALFPDH